MQPVVGFETSPALQGQVVLTQHPWPDFSGAGGKKIPKTMPADERTRLFALQSPTRNLLCLHAKKGADALSQELEKQTVSCTLAP